MFHEYLVVTRPLPLNCTLALSLAGVFLRALAAGSPWLFFVYVCVALPRVDDTVLLLRDFCFCSYQIVSIRAEAESIEVEPEALSALGKIGAKTSLR